MRGITVDAARVTAASVGVLGTVPVPDPEEMSAREAERVTHAARVTVDRVIAAGLRSLLLRPLKLGYQRPGEIESFMNTFVGVHDESTRSMFIPAIITAFDSLYPDVRAENPELAAALAKYRPVDARVPAGVVDGEVLTGGQ